MATMLTDRLYGATSSLAVKAPCRAATTASITLSGLQEIDGIEIASGDRILVKNQTNQIDNGIWVVAEGAWSRAPDFDGTRDVVRGTQVVVAEGTLYEGHTFFVSSDTPVVGEEAVSFTAYYAAANDISDAMRPVVSSVTLAAARTALNVYSKSQVDSFYAAAPYGNVKNYGAVGDGVTDDTAAFNATIAAHDTIVVPWTASGYKITGSLALTKAVTIVGLNGDTRLILGASMSSNLFTISSSDILIRKLKIIGDGTQTNSLFKFKTSTSSPQRVILEDIITSGAYVFASDDNAAGAITSLWIHRCQHKQPRGAALSFYDALAYIFIEDFSADYVGVTASTSNTPIISFSNAAGVSLRRIDATGGTISGMGNRWGFNFEACSAVWLSECMADTLGGYGYRFYNSSGIHLDCITASLCDQFGALITGCSDVHGRGIYVGGRSSLSGTATQHGVYISGASTGIALSSVKTHHNTGSGVAIDGASTAFISSLQSSSNSLYGYAVASGCAALLSGAQFASNTSGNYSLGGSTAHIAGAQLTSGALVASATGPATA